MVKIKNCMEGGSLEGLLCRVKGKGCEGQGAGK